jgi:protein-S-isoprenylcysteine O-methyltransferase Ste14
MSWLVIAVFSWGLLHSLLASLRIKDWVKHVFGAGVSRFYRLAYNIIACISFLPVLVVAALIPDRRLYLAPFPWSALMLMGEFLALAVLAIGFKQTDPWEFLGLRKPGKSDKPSKLMTSGLYRYVRHPLYTAGMAFIWLMPLMTVNVLGINLSLTVYVIIGAYFEERKLQREFGQEYTDYQRVTPMFIPFLKGNKPPHPAS